MSLPGFAICLYLALPLSVILWQGEKGGVSHMSLPGFALVTPLVLSQGEEGGGCSDICHYPSSRLSLH